jgi:glucosamine-6-phosphate deaminase
MQQANEGWFPSFESVPAHAISMSINQIMKSNTIICTVPDERKSEAVKVVLEGEISNLCPASILQSHNNTFFYLDMAAASKLRRETSE